VEDQVRLPRALGHVFRVMLLSLARALPVCANAAAPASAVALLVRPILVWVGDLGLQGTLPGGEREPCPLSVCRWNGKGSGAGRTQSSLVGVGRDKIAPKGSQRVTKICAPLCVSLCTMYSMFFILVPQFVSACD
jgi:hypothetical protein